MEIEISSATSACAIQNSVHRFKRHHVNFAEIEAPLAANVSRFIAAARSCGSMVNISIEGWEDRLGAKIIVARRR
jgi:hypothetical protein